MAAYLKAALAGIPAFATPGSIDSRAHAFSSNAIGARTVSGRRAASLHMFGGNEPFSSADGLHFGGNSNSHAPTSEMPAYLQRYTARLIEFPSKLDVVGEPVKDFQYARIEVSCEDQLLWLKYSYLVPNKKVSLRTEYDKLDSLASKYFVKVFEYFVLKSRDEEDTAKYSGYTVEHYNTLSI